MSVKNTHVKENALDARNEFNAAELIIAQDCRYSLNDRATRLNNNVLVIGGSGTGKTQTIVSPNLRQAVGSYVVFDPKGQLYKKYGAYLKERGYLVGLLDFTWREQSMHYNPLAVVGSPQEIMKLSEILAQSEDAIGTSADPFWDKITKLFLNGLIGYLCETDALPRTLESIPKLMREGERYNNGDSTASPLSDRFNALKKAHPDSWAYTQFNNVNVCPNDTYNCVRATLAAKFANLDTPEIRSMTRCSDIDFKLIGSRKTAIFVTVSDTDRSMDELANLFITQSMQQLCGFADRFKDGRLPVPVRFILDDFATNCRIADFPRIISTIRSRSVSAMIMIQSEAQLTQYYGFDDKTVISNCDTYVYLGGNDIATARSVSERSDKPLDRILNMPVGTCWVFRRGEEPVFTRVNDIPIEKQRTVTM